MRENLLVWRPPVHNRLQMKIVTVPVRSDNYAYLLIDDVTRRTAIVDPYDVVKVEAALEREGIPVECVNAILTTHHHHDHAGGNKEFVSHSSVPYADVLLSPDVCVRLLRTNLRYWVLCLLGRPARNTPQVKRHPGVTVYGGSSRVAALTKQVRDRDAFKIGDIDIGCAVLYTGSPAHDYSLLTGFLCYWFLQLHGDAMPYPRFNLL
jgi:hydroxyacylglutathione hydrolase